jgi:pectate lyase
MTDSIEVAYAAVFERNGGRVMNRNSLYPMIILAVCLLVIPTQAQVGLPAFPGAEGFGAVATGGRGGQVITVTNLNPDGPGSLQEALNTPGARTIVFSVSGVIPAIANIVYGDVTIAGQTSPGGITVRGMVCDGHYDMNDCDNLIIRHIRSRPAAHLMPGGAQDDALRLDGIENVIVDHVSLANATDEAMQISLARNITVQNTILAETVGDHAQFGGMLINYSHSERPQDNLSIHHNMWYRIQGRLPEISCELVGMPGGASEPEIPSQCSAAPLHLEVSSNLLWDAGGPVTYNDNSIEGQGQPEAGIFLIELNWVDNFMVVRDDYSYGMIGSSVIAQAGNHLYFEGNHLNLYPDFADAQLAYCCNDFNLYYPIPEPPVATMITERHPFPAITYTPNDELVAYMIGSVGAFPRDPMDTRYVQALMSGEIEALPYDQPAADDAFDTISDPPPAPTDSDLDGMPDDWETAHNLDPNTPDNNGTELSPEGYTNIEVYLNELADQLVEEGAM